MTTKRERAAALAAMTKAELVRTVTKLDARQTKLLNEIAALKSRLATYDEHVPCAKSHEPNATTVAALEAFDAECIARREQPWDAGAKAAAEAYDANGPISEGDLHEAAAHGGKFPWETDK